MSQEGMVPERLLAAVTDLTRVVESLEKTLKEDYPKRAEINRRRIQFAIVIVLAIIASYFFTVATISACFLSDTARTGHAPSFCSVLPNYNKAQNSNQRVLNQFRHLLQQTDKNEKRIHRIERHIARLEAQNH